MNGKLLFWIVAFLVFLVDRISKNIIVGTVSGIVKVNEFLNIVLVYNRGIVFGLGHNARSGWIFVFASILAIIVVLSLYKRMKAEDRFSLTSLGMVMGGGVGNLVDRIYYGYVIDFIDLHVGRYHWPAFNFADTFIVIGVFLLLYSWGRNR